MSKVWVIGLDGGTYEVIDYLVGRGELPHFKEFLDLGSRATLMSTIPPITPAAWSSFFTGLNPGKHGVFDFFRRETGTYRLKPVCGADVNGYPLWRQASDLGKRTCVYNVPMTYPASRVEGVMISGMDAPGLSLGAFFPADFKRQILAKFPDFAIESSVNPNYLIEHFSDPVGEFINNLNRQMELQLNVIQFLSELEDWDLFFSVIRSPDAFQHAFWQPAAKTMSGADLEESEARNGRAVFDCYKKIDKELGKWMEGMDHGRNLILMSDHGFGSLQKEVCINRILAEAGLLAFRKKSPRREVREAVTSYISRRLPAEARVRMRHFIRHTLKVRSTFSGSMVADIDWERTLVYSVGQFGCLFTNLKGREPNGLVAGEKERRAILDQAEAALSATADPEDDGLVFTDFCQREELFTGPFISRVPDMIAVMRNYAYRGVYSTSAELDGEALIRKPALDWGPLITSGTHRAEGILAMAGPDIRKGDLRKANILDLAPTICSLLGLPGQSGYDGTILADALVNNPGKITPRLRHSSGQASTGGGMYTPPRKRKRSVQGCKTWVTFSPAFSTFLASVLPFVLN